MRFKVYGGMTDGGETLCSTCSRSIITRGRGRDEEIVDCHIIGQRSRRITFRVLCCSSYNDARLPSLGELLENAWVLRRGTKRQPAGFIHARDLRRRNSPR